MASFSSSVGASYFASNALPLVVLTPNFNPLTLQLDRQNYYYWRAQVISIVRAHGFEGFLLGSALLRLNLWMFLVIL